MAGNKQSLKVLDELMQKLTISKEASEIKEASASLATFMNGRIEDQDVPSKLVIPDNIPFFVSFFFFTTGHIMCGFGTGDDDYARKVS
jgi:glycerol kinase